MRKKILFTLTAIAVLLTAVIFAVQAESTVQLNVNLNFSGSVSVYVDGAYKGEAPFSANISKNSQVKLVNNSENFLFFSDDLGNTVGNNGEYTFTAVSSANITAWNKNTNTNKLQIIYKNTNTSKQVLATSNYSVSLIDSAFTEHLISSASSAGYDFVSWDKTVSEIIEAGKNGAGTVIVTPVYAPSQVKVNILVNGGSITSENPDNGKFALNSAVELTADSPKSGEKFAYWTNAHGIIISANETITVVVAGNETYTAHFVNEGESVDVLPAVGISAYYDSELDRIVSHSVRFLPDGYDIVSYGLIYAKDSVKNEEQMTLDGVDGQNVKVAQYTDATVKNGTLVNRVSCENMVSLRAYLIYKDSQNTLTTIYSDAVNVGKSTLIEAGIYDLAFDTAELPEGINAVGTSISSGKLMLSNGYLDALASLSNRETVKLYAENVVFGTIPASKTPVIAVNKYVRSETSGDGISVDWSSNISSASLDIVSVDAEGCICLGDQSTGVKITAGAEYDIALEYNKTSKMMTLYLNGSTLASAKYEYSADELVNFTFVIEAKGMQASVDSLRVVSVVTSDECPHNYIANVVAPTCVGQGYTVYTCEVCGDYYEDDFVSATGVHQYEKVSQNGALITYECKYCDETKNEYTFVVTYNEFGEDCYAKAQRIASALSSKLGYTPIIMKSGEQGEAKTVNVYSISPKAEEYGWTVSDGSIDIYVGLYADADAAISAFESYLATINSLDDAVSASYTVSPTKTLNNLAKYVSASSALINANTQYAMMKNDVISSANTDVSGISGTVYYVSENGSNSNNGRSPENAVKSSSAISPSYGDAVLFERGGLYREHITAVSGVTYGCYGQGEKPIICGSAQNYAGLWTRVEGNIWKLDMPAGTIVDPGMIIFGAHTYSVEYVEENVGNRVMDRHTVNGVYDSAGDGYSQLVKNFDFYSGSPDLSWNKYNQTSSYDLFVYYDGDLNADFSSIEIAEDGHLFLVNSKSDVMLDGLCFKYTGGHGVRGGHTGGSNNLTVKNCVFGWIGGSRLESPGTTRYGNAIEIFGSTTGFNVYNNWIYEIYDTGITFQYSGSTVSGDITVKNVDIYDNIVERSFWGFESWVYPNGGVAILENIKVRDNLFREIQNTWGIDMHVTSGNSVPTNGGVFVLGGFDGSDATAVVEIYGNTIDRTFVKGHTGGESHAISGKSRGYCTRVFKIDTSVDDHYGIYENDLILYGDQWIGRYEVDSTHPSYGTYNGQSKYDWNFMFDAGNDEIFDFFGLLPYASDNKVTIIERPADLNQ